MPWRFVAVLGGILIAMPPLAYLVIASKRSEEAAQASVCEGRLTEIAIAMNRYCDKYGHFPPAYIVGSDGKPVHSWRVLLLEFLEPLTYQRYRFDEPWNGPNNRKIEAEMPRCYSCPLDRSAKLAYHTNYYVVVGRPTLFPGSDTVRVQDIQRPKSETILVVESINCNAHWMEPKDIPLESLVFDGDYPSISSHHAAGPLVCMIDGRKVRAKGLNLREALLITSAK